MNAQLVDRNWYVFVYVLLLFGCSETKIQLKPEAELVKSELVEEQEESFHLACFISAANTAEIRKKIHMQSVNKWHKSIQSTHSVSMMVSHADFCDHESKWSSLVYHAEDGSGWKVSDMFLRSGEPFTWAVFTSDHPNTKEQIYFNVQYLAMQKELKASFIEKYGIARHEEALRKHIEAELGMKSEFVSSGAWLELYFRQ